MVLQESSSPDRVFDTKNISTERLAKLHAALLAFTVPDEKSLKRPPKGFSRCPMKEIDEYFEMVAKLGKPLFKWDIIRAAFLWKLDLTMSEMLCVEAESLAEGTKDTMITDEELRTQRDFIMRKAEQFDGTPFTIQRLCELLTTPSRHYKRTDKYLRALEKNINVVTTITENGERVTGVEQFSIVDDERPQRIEQNFFLKVDECDTPIETKILEAKVKMENGGSDEINEENQMAIDDDAIPINLSASRKDCLKCSNEDSAIKKETEVQADVKSTENKALENDDGDKLMESEKDEVSRGEENEVKPEQTRVEGNEKEATERCSYHDSNNEPQNAQDSSKSNTAHLCASDNKTK
ncbi:unnamed protein product [Anisakis simplex]|uniref:Serine/threonine-protein phosphatase 4 regulatory subunit 2 n=1 Tax=Anisakis simplex TaxID=6269 RepID=A0A0M3KAI3_ANISI|nr:unnamed protein product [Anisakis simplex]